MDCANAGGIDFAKEPLPRGAVFDGKRLVVESFITGGANAAAHFAGSGVGERDGDELAEIDRWRAVRAGGIEVGEKSRSQDVRFATAGPRGKRNGYVATFDRKRLFRG